ncbi:MAG: chromosome segregation protein SMC [Verrucomicrobia bacterium]|nr:MAG: chromosome segregation protein SMC [Verrucomicrobiota bacterium]
MKSPRPTPLCFARLRLENWKNFAAADVALAPRVFLVGPNASGKSNFLDAFRFLRDIASSGGGLQEAVRRRGGLRAIRSLAARRNSDVTIEAVVADPEGQPTWQYELTFNLGPRDLPMIRRECVRRGNRTFVDRPNRDDHEDPERLTQTHLEQVTANRDFRELGLFFASVRYLHVVPQLVREPDRSVGRSQDPYGGDFLEQIARTPEKTRQARLRRIAKALAVALPQLAEIELWRDKRGIPHLRGRYQHWRPRGAWLTEEQFSDGTLRLMGLLWVAMDGQGPLLLEEPELSLHPAVVRHLPQMFARLHRATARQVILSSHSPELLHDDGIGLDEVLLLLPGPEGTAVRPAGDFAEIRQLLEQGLPLAEAVLPLTRPEHAEQLSLFGDV